MSGFAVCSCATCVLVAAGAEGRVCVYTWWEGGVKKEGSGVDNEQRSTGARTDVALPAEATPERTLLEVAVGRVEGLAE